ncbi:MAG: hypothetical protein ACE37F_18950 [Nannocystaceae bacterium]|nr:hypothetical protein [bacterium]
MPEELPDPASVSLVPIPFPVDVLDPLELLPAPLVEVSPWVVSPFVVPGGSALAFDPSNVSDSSAPYAVDDPQVSGPDVVVSPSPSSAGQPLMVNPSSSALAARAMFAGRPAPTGCPQCGQ